MSRAEPETKEDLETYVSDRVTEGLRLEFKASALLTSEKDRRDIAKTVAGMATAEGGLILVGVVESKQTRVAERLDDGLEPAVVSKETIEQLIQDNVSPRVDGLRITPVPLGGDRFAYAIHVPASDRAPHMFEQRYYKRRNFQTVPMEDYEVRDVFYRRRAPRLELLWDAGKLDGCYLVTFRVRNPGLAAAEHLCLELEFVHSLLSPASWAPMDYPPVLFCLRPPLGHGRTTHVLRYIHTDAAPTRPPEPVRLPPLIYPGFEAVLEEAKVLVRPDANPDAVITARLYARDMPMIEMHIKARTVIDRASL